MISGSYVLSRQSDNAWYPLAYFSKTYMDGDGTIHAQSVYASTGVCRGKLYRLVASQGQGDVDLYICYYTRVNHNGIYSIMFSIDWSPPGNAAPIIYH